MISHLSLFTELKIVSFLRGSNHQSSDQEPDALPQSQRGTPDNHCKTNIIIYWIDYAIHVDIALLARVQEGSQSWLHDLTRLSSHGNAVELHCHLSLFVGQSRDYLHMTSIAKILKLLTNFIIKVLHKSLVHLMIDDLLTFGIKMSDFGAKTCLVCCIIGFPNLATSSLFTSNFLVINFSFGSKLVL